MNQVRTKAPDYKANGVSKSGGRSADKLRYRYPRGESYEDVIARLDPVITEYCVSAAAETGLPLWIGFSARLGEDGRVPDVVWDGFTNPEKSGADYAICVRNGVC